MGKAMDLAAGTNSKTGAMEEWSCKMNLFQPAPLHLSFRGAAAPDRQRCEQ